MTLQLRPYQRECVERIFAELENRTSTLAVLATGLGKTVIFANVAKRWQTGRVLVLAHREELIHQAAAKIEEVTGEKPGIEMADFTDRYSGIFGSSPFVVASVQTLSQDSRLLHPVYDPSNFGLVIYDEAHHAVQRNKTYGRIHQHFRQNPELRELGVTATPDRADQEGMQGIFDSVAFDYGIREGVADGWLVPIEQQYVVVESLDFSQVRSQAGDLSESDLERIMREESMMHRLVGPTLEAAGDEPTLIFTPGVASAELAAEIIKRHRGEGSAVCLHGKTDKTERRKKLAAYARREFQFLCGCGLFLEGFDQPAISVVAMARPTKSRALYAQAIGRGTRTLPGVLTPELSEARSIERAQAIAASGKPRLLVLDFVGNSGRHKLISTADILAGKVSEAALDRAKASARGKPVNIAEEAERIDRQMRAEAEEERRRKEEEKRLLAEKVARDKERIKAIAKARYQEVDPFGEDAVPDRSAGYGKSGPPITAKQAKMIHSLGLDHEGMSKREASEIIADFFRRKQKGLASPKQAKLLKSCGENDQCTKTKAEVLISILKARGYHKRDYPLTQDRLRIVKKPGGFSLVVRDSLRGQIVVSERLFPTPEACRDHFRGIIEQAPAKVSA